MNDVLMMKHLDDVLLIDDDELSAMLTKIILQNSKKVRNIQVSQDGQEALDHIKEAFLNGEKYPFNLILLDLNMPVMDGWEFLSQYSQLKKEHAQLPPVAILTSSIQNDDIKKSKSYPEVVCFVSKPFSNNAFTQIMEKLEG